MMGQKFLSGMLRKNWTCDDKLNQELRSGVAKPEPVRSKFYLFYGHVGCALWKLQL